MATIFFSYAPETRVYLPLPIAIDIAVMYTVASPLVSRFNRRLRLYAIQSN